MYIYEEYISLGPYHGVLYYTHVIYIILSEISFYIIPNPYDTLVYKQITSYLCWCSLMHHNLTFFIRAILKNLKKSVQCIFIYLLVNTLCCLNY